MTDHFDPRALRLRVNRDCFGFLFPHEVERLANHPHSAKWPLLIRYGSGRCVASADCVAHLCDMIRDSGDYVRDVSFPAQGHAGTDAHLAALAEPDEQDETLHYRSEA